MDKSLILSTYNDQFIELIEDIEQLFPDDLEITTSKNSILLIRKANPKKIITLMTPYLLKYKSEINSGNIDFFIKKNYSSEITDETANNPSTILDKIDSLRSPINKMDDADKNKIVEYMQNLLQLSEAYSK